jgi:hypothetical protein
MYSSPSLDCAGRRRSSATLSGFQRGRPPRSLLCLEVPRRVSGFAGVLAGGDPSRRRAAVPLMRLLMGCSGS